MSLNISRTAEPLRFDTGIGQAGYAEVMDALVAGNSATLRTPGGFGLAARGAAKALRGRGTAAADAAAREIETLLADTDLFERYRMSLLET